MGQDNSRNNGAKCFFTINEVQNAPDLEPIWGNWLFRDSLIIQVAEPGIGKTTFNYLFSKALVDNEEFLGVRPNYNDLTVLYCDWESSRSLIKSRMRTLGYPVNHQNLICFNDPVFSLHDIESSIDRLINEHNFHFDVIFIDPLRMAFSMKDENENAEGSRQMKYLRGLSQKWHCSLIIVHHSSKAELHGTKKASGAYARIGLVDINWNFERLGPGYNPNIFMFSIPKNRLMDDNFVVFLERNDGAFEVVDPPLGYTTDGEYIAGTLKFSARGEIFSVMEPGEILTPQMLMEMTNEKYTRKTVHQALGQLIALGHVDKVGNGLYRKVL